MQLLSRLTNTLFGTFFFLALIALGVMLIIGAWKRWPWLVDPPEKYWFIDSQAFIKKFLGPRAAVYFAYFMGIVTVAVSVYVLLKGLLFDK